MASVMVYLKVQVVRALASAPLDYCAASLVFVLPKIMLVASRARLACFLHLISTTDACQLTAYMVYV
jgi:hypothetical protein